MRTLSIAAAACFAALTMTSAKADEQLLGYVQGSETMPEGGWQFYQIVTARSGKSVGTYEAYDTTTEIEYGVSDRFNVSGAIKTLSINTKDIVIDGYLPGPEKFTLKPSGVEGELKYSFLQPAVDPVGLSMTFGVDYAWIDPHSGRDKTTLSAELGTQLQKYFLEGQIVTMGNFAMETTYADRKAIADLPEDFDWPTDPEMEIELIAGAGLSYRFARGWYIGAETLYETEFETEVGQERWSIFAGPSLHYANRDWWLTATWFPQIRGGGEMFDGQKDHLHLIEKTKNEYKFKFGLNF